MNFDKLKACIVYVCKRANDQLDPVKLNKVLWYSDTETFLETGSSITGSRYVRKPMGPVCGAMQAAITKLAEDKMIIPGRRPNVDTGNWTADFPVCDDSLSSSLSDQEKSTLDHAIKRVCRDHTTAQISDRTHGEVWELAKNGEEIPLYTMYAERLGEIKKEHFEAIFA